MTLFLQSLNPMNGKIIEYIDHGKFVCTICLQAKGNKLHLLTPSNREVNISQKRAIVVSMDTVNTSRPREELLEKLKRIEHSRIHLKGQVDVKELWDLVREEKEIFDYKYLAQLVFGKDITDDHLSALVRALFEDRLHFKMKDGFFLANSDETVENTLKQREEKALKEERLRQGSLWLKGILQGKRPKAPPFKEDIIKLLVGLALYGTEAPDLKYGKELLSLVGVSEIRETRTLLTALGVWEEDENLELMRLGIGIPFTEKQLDESSYLEQSAITVQGREDLRHLPIITIDSDETCDFDDAVSLQVDGDVIHLGVHIADVASVISPGSVLDRGAAERAASLYLPRRQIPMIPQRLSQGTLSLKQGCDRQALSLLLQFNKTGELLAHRFVPSVIQVKHKLTYDEVNEALYANSALGSEHPFKDETQAEFLEQIHMISRRMRQKRMNQDALNLSLPDLQVKIDLDASISLKLVEQDTPSRMIIAELMILYNWLAARFCRDYQIPVLFRTQPEPSERLPADEDSHLFYVFQQRRKLSPLQILTTPKPHSGLGLEVYTHCTSPIRRYFDLLVQRQLLSFLMGMTPIYNEKQLEEHRIFIEPILRNQQRIQRNRQRYWTLKYLSQHQGKIFKALILNEFKNKYRIVLTDFLLVAEIQRQNGVILNPAEEIYVKVKRADPWDDIIKLEYAD